MDKEIPQDVGWLIFLGLSLLFLMAITVWPAIPAWQAGGLNATYAAEEGEYGVRLVSETVSHTVGIAALLLLGGIASFASAWLVHVRRD